MKEGATRLTKNTGGTLHAYYYQVQCQLCICGHNYGDFVVWTQRSYHCESIYRNDDLWEEMLPKAQYFFRELPEMLGNCHIRQPLIGCAVNMNAASVNTGEAGVNMNTASVNTGEAGVNMNTASVNTGEAGVNMNAASVNTGEAGVNMNTACVNTGEAGVNMNTASVNTGEVGVNMNTVSVNTGEAGVNADSANVISGEVAQSVWCYCSRSVAKWWTVTVAAACVVRAEGKVVLP